MALPAKTSTLQTRQVVAPLAALAWSDLPPTAQAETVRHLVDTVGAMVAGTRSATSAAVTQALAPAAGDVPVPGQLARVGVLDAAYLGGVAAHSLELDDGYREGSVHPGACVVPAALALAHQQASSGQDLLAAIAAGYQATAVVARAHHPAIRRRGFHPTGVAGVFGSAAAGGRLLALDADALAGAFGTAASSAAGLFAFLSGGSDVKRLHAGAAARNGLFAALLARRGVLGPPAVLEATDGFAAAYAGPPPDGADSSTPSPLLDGWAVEDCYLKPHACCRHLHTAVDVLIALLAEHGLHADAIERIEVDTYGVAAAHARAAWTDPSSAQLSFPFVLAVAAQRGAVELADFEPARLADPALASLAARVRIRTDPELDRGYPAGRPARVTVTTATGPVIRTGQEARGARRDPLSDSEVHTRFTGLVEPVLGATGCARLLADLLGLGDLPDVRPVLEHAASARQGRDVPLLWQRPDSRLDTGERR